MKKRIILSAICLLVAVGLCLAVSLMPESEGGLPVIPIGPRPTTSPSSGTDPTPPPAQPGEVRIYLADPQRADALRQIAQNYTNATGVTVIVTQAMDNATILGMTDPQAVQCWEGRLYDLSNTAVLQKLYSREFALEVDGKPVALAMDVTAYGLIYNSKLLAQGFGTRTDVGNFADLKVAVEYITSQKSSNGFHAFGAADFSSTQFAQLLAGISDDPAQIRSFVDLYLANDTASGDPLTNFVAEKTAFYVGGAWEYDEISSLGIHQLDILPLYTAEDGKFSCVCSHYWGVNAEVNENDLQATLKFLNWFVTAGEDGTTPVDGLGYFSPFQDAKGAPNAFYRLVRRYLAEEPVQVMWSLAPTLSQADLTALTQALAAYNRSATDENWAAVAAILTGERIPE